MRLPSQLPNLNVSLTRRSAADIVGLDIQPGLVAAVKARVNGAIVAERAAALPLQSDVVRDGEVVDQAALADTLRELFASSGLGKRVRIGVANQRTVLRTLELPPVSDYKELTAAVNFQAQEQVPMPLSNAVLDFHALGITDTPAGPRQHVVLVAAQRDMIERLLAAVRSAGLTPEGVDLSAFALIRSLYRPAAEQEGRVLYLNVDGLTNLAIAEGPVCRFTRVVGGGLEGMAAELAERRGIPLADARALIAAVDLTAPAAPAEPATTEVIEAPAPEPASDASPQEGNLADPDEEPTAVVSPPAAPAADEPAGDAAEPVESVEVDVAVVLENGIREIAGEVRNSLEFHRSQERGGEVSHVVLSGSAADIPGFATSLQAVMGVEVKAADVGVAAEVSQSVSANRLAVATGLAAPEAPR
jgi:type IV pilus assembly protein PilM